MEDDPFAWTVESRLKRLENDMEAIARYTKISEHHAAIAKRHSRRVLTASIIVAVLVVVQFVLYVATC